MPGKGVKLYLARRWTDAGVERSEGKRGGKCDCVALQSQEGSERLTANTERQDEWEGEKPSFTTAKQMWINKTSGGFLYNLRTA